VEVDLHKVGVQEILEVVELRVILDLLELLVLLETQGPQEILLQDRQEEPQRLETLLHM